MKLIEVEDETRGSGSPVCLCWSVERLHGKRGRRCMCGREVRENGTKAGVFDESPPGNQLKNTRRRI